MQFRAGADEADGVAPPEAVEGQVGGDLDHEVGADAGVGEEPAQVPRVVDGGDQECVMFWQRPSRFP